MLPICGSNVADFPKVSEKTHTDWFPLGEATICTDAGDYKVVSIAAQMLADDVERVTSARSTIVSATSLKKLPHGATVVAGTVGHSRIIDELVRQKAINVSAIKGKWESYIVTIVKRPSQGQLLVIAGSDRRGTAFGLTTLSEAIGVSPWYWWADVTPTKKRALYIEPGTFVQGEPSVQYRGIFINDERFGGWARWAELKHGKVGPDTYKRVFELLLRLKANYLWPAMHPGTQAFNDNPENARLADDYAIVMGSSHCEQMLRNNEGEWKAVNERAKRQARLDSVEREQLRPEVKAVNQRAKERGEEGLGDFNYITNRQTMQNYWETRVKTNGRYENTYTLGLRGIHDYPMEGANTTAERVALMQQAINDQRDMLRRNIKKPIEEIPQVLCTYEEVLEASATPINNVWHAPYVGPMWSRVGTMHLKKGENHLCITDLKADARIDQIFLGLYPPFAKEPRLRIPASHYQNKQGGIQRIVGLGYTDGVLVQPFDTPSYQQENIKAAPYAEYELDLQAGDTTIEIRTLPTLHVYDGRDIRYAVQLGNSAPTIFSIHEGDFTAEWRWNVLRGYASRSLPVTVTGRQRLRIYLLDPGIVLQEVLIHSPK